MKFDLEVQHWRPFDVAGGSIELKLRRLTRIEKLDVIGAIRAGDLGRSEELTLRSVTDWKGVEDGQGNPIPFSLSNLDKLLSEDGLGSQVSDYMLALNGFAPKQEDPKECPPDKN